MTIEYELSLNCTRLSLEGQIIRLRFDGSGDGDGFGNLAGESEYTAYDSDLVSNLKEISTLY